MIHTRFALRRPVTTLMTFVAISLDRRHRDRPAAARAVPGHPLPWHPGHDSLCRIDTRGSRTADHAPGRGGDRDAVRHQGDPLDLLRDRRRARGLLPVGPRSLGGRLRSPHAAGVHPPRVPAGREPDPDADVRGRRRPRGHDPHREPGGPDAPVRHARPLPQETPRAPRRRGARLAGGRRAAGAQDPRRPGAPRRLRRRHRAPARCAGGRQLLGQRRRGHGRRAALPRPPHRRVPDHRGRALASS